MIIDSHSHAWQNWPYQPEVPDSLSRGTVEQLLHEMDQNGVDRAAIVCAQITHNPENNAYVAEQIQRFPGRLYQIADLDCEWSPTYHTPGAAQRLREMAERWPLTGFTHYLRNSDDASWLYSEEGLAMFHAAAELGLLASIACAPHHHPAIRKVAERFPQVPILCHHLGLVHQGSASRDENLKQVLDSARLPNIYLKVSGFAYPVAKPWEYPYHEAQETLRAEYEHYGPRRLCWGSDYPVVRYFMTYRQSLEVLRTHCDFIPPEDKDWILGKNLEMICSR